MLRYLTAGESHGPALVAIIEGMVAGVSVSAEAIELELARRRLGYGRGARMKVEQDQLEILGGVRHGRTMGSPIAMVVRNSEWPKWQRIMATDEAGAELENPPLTRPRPGHADLAGMLKYGAADARNVLERASARETAARVVAGAVCKSFLEALGIRIVSHVVAIGSVVARSEELPRPEDFARTDASELRCLDTEAEKAMVAEIAAARADGDTLGGVFEVVAWDVPPGLGSHVHWDRHIDGDLAQAMMSIPAIKGVEIGPGFEVAGRRGSSAHDEIAWSPDRGYVRPTSRSGGTEGGMTFGGPLQVRAAMKPLSSLSRPLHTVDMATKEQAEAITQRSDVCAVPAAAVVGEAAVAFVLARAALEKFGGDSLNQTRAGLRAYLDEIRAR